MFPEPIVTNTSRFIAYLSLINARIEFLRPTTLKTECVDHEGYRSKQEAKQNLFEYIEVFYNQRRRHSYLGYVSPAEYEQRHASQLMAPLFWGNFRSLEKPEPEFNGFGSLIRRKPAFGEADRNQSIASPFFKGSDPLNSEHEGPPTPTDPELNYPEDAAPMGGTIESVFHVFLRTNISLIGIFTFPIATSAAIVVTSSASKSR